MKKSKKKNNNVPLEDYEVLLEMSDILSDKTTLTNLHKALDDEKTKNLWKRDTNGKWKKAA